MPVFGQLDLLPQDGLVPRITETFGVHLEMESSHSAPNYEYKVTVNTLAASSMVGLKAAWKNLMKRLLCLDHMYIMILHRRAVK